MCNLVRSLLQLYLGQHQEGKVELHHQPRLPHRQPGLQHLQGLQNIFTELLFPPPGALIELLREKSLLSAVECNLSCQHP